MATLKRVISSLQPSRRYAVRVRALSKFGVTSHWSEALDFVTPADNSVPSAPEGLVIDFDTPDLILQWDNVTTNTDGSIINDLGHYRVTLSVPGGGLRNFETTQSFFHYPFVQNKRDFNVPQPEFDVFVRAIDVSGKASLPLTGTAVNPPPSTPEDPVGIASFTMMSISMAPNPVDSDIEHYIVERADSDQVPFEEVATTTGNNFIDTGLESSTFLYRYKVSDYFGQESPYSAVLELSTTGVPGMDTEPPIAVEDFAIHHVGINDVTREPFVDLTWTPNIVDDDLSHFELRVLRTSDNFVRSMIIGPGASSHRVEGLLGDTEYSFLIYAYDYSGNRSGASTELTITTPVDTSAPDMPTVIGTVSGIRSIVVRWDIVLHPNFSHYELHGSTSPDFTPDVDNKLYSGQSTQYYHATAEAETWYFQLRAVNSNGQASDFTAEFSETSEGIEISSDPPEDVAFPSGGLTGQSYFHGSAEHAYIDAVWTQNTDEHLAGYVFAWREQGGSWVETLVGLEASHRVTGLEPGKTYEVRIKAFDKFGNRSTSWSVTRQTTVSSQSGDTPATVTGVSAESGVGRVIFSWDEITTPEHNDYRLQVATNATFTANVRNIFTKTTEYHYTGITGITYYARVQARDQFGSISADWSTVVNGTPEGISTEDVNVLDLSQDGKYIGVLKADRIAIGAASTYEPGYDPSEKATTDDIDETREYADLIEEAIRGDFTGTATGTLIDGARIQTGTVDAELLVSDIAIINGLRVQSLFEINTSGFIQSENFHSTNKTGFRVGNTGAELYQGSIVLGGSGLNINTETDQLWFGSSNFNSAAFRVNASGRARFGTTDTGIHLWEDGSLRIGSTATTAPVYISNAGAATFRNVVLTGTDMGAAAKIIDTPSFIVTKEGNVTAGNITATGGTIGDVSIDGASGLTGGTITGAQFNIGAGGITFTGNGHITWGDSANGGIRLANSGFINNTAYRSDSSAGFEISNDGVVVNEGLIKSAAFQIGVGSENLLINSSFLDGTEVADHWAVGSGADNTFEISGEHFRFGNSSQKITMTQNASVVDVIQNVSMPGGEPFPTGERVAFSFWAKQTNGSPRSAQIYVEKLDQTIQDFVVNYPLDQDLAGTIISGGGITPSNITASSGVGAQIVENANHTDGFALDVTPGTTTFNLDRYISIKLSSDVVNVQLIGFDISGDGSFRVRSSEDNFVTDIALESIPSPTEVVDYAFPVDISADTEVEIRIYPHTTNAGGSIYFSHIILNGRSSIISSAPELVWDGTPSNLTINEWSRLGGVFIPPSGTEVLRVHARILNPVSGDVFFIDGAQLEVADHVTSYKPRTLELPTNYIQDAWVGNLSADKLISGAIGAHTIHLNGPESAIQSINWSDDDDDEEPGVSGWRIAGDGTAIFQDGSITVIGAGGVVSFDSNSFRARYGNDTGFFIDETGVYIGGSDELSADVMFHDNKTIFQSSAGSSTFVIDSDPADGKILKLVSGNEDSFYLDVDGQAYFRNGSIDGRVLDPGSVPDVSIESLAADKLTAGSLGIFGLNLDEDGRLITGGMILDAEGIRLYDELGRTTIRLDAQTGRGEFSGAITSSEISIGSGDADDYAFNNFESQTVGAFPSGWSSSISTNPLTYVSIESK